MARAEIAASALKESSNAKESRDPIPKIRISESGFRSADVPLATPRARAPSFGYPPSPCKLLQHEQDGLGRLGVKVAYIPPVGGSTCDTDLIGNGREGPPRAA